MSRPCVVITTDYLSPGHEVGQYLSDAGLDPRFRICESEDEMVAALRDADAVICSGEPAISARAIQLAVGLKVISRTGVGYNSIDIDAATSRGIPVCTLPGANRHSVAEYAFTLMLACARRLNENLSEVQNGGWISYDGVELAGKTVGIIGLGTIGKEVAQRARAFEMRILAHDVVRDPVFAEAFQVSYVPLEQLLRESDFVSIHAALNAQNHHLINAERLAMMKPSAYLVNTARGGIVDTEALYRAIRDKRIAGAGLDVHEQEPLVESSLRGFPNVYLSPHAGGATVDVRRLSPFRAADAVIQVLRGERPAHVINPEVFK